MSKSKIAPHRVPNAKAKAVGVASDAADLRSRRQARVAAKAKLSHTSAPAEVPASLNVTPQIPPPLPPEYYVKAPEQLDRSVVSTVQKTEKSSEPAQEALPESVTLSVPSRLLRAALGVAAKDDVRFYLNSVRIHQTPDGQTRVVATDGHRLLVMNIAGVEPIEWASQGINLPREQLQRIMRYFGKETTSIEISFGLRHQHVVVTAPGDCASFKVAPIDATYPDYQRIMDSGAEAFSAERDGVATAMLDPDYLKSASAVAAAFESEGIMPHVGSADAKGPVVFTFQGIDDALLYVMPKGGSDDYQLPEATVKMHGRASMKKTSEDLRERAAKCLANAKKAKHEKFKALFKAKAARLTAQADSIEAANSVRITGPKAAEGETIAAAVASAKAVTTASVH